MKAREVRRYVDDLLAGRRPPPFRPDEFEGAQIRTAIDLQAARAGAEAPRPEFLSDLHGRLAAQMAGGASLEVAAGRPGATRRQVIVSTSAAAAAAAVAVTADRLVLRGETPPFAGDTTASGSELVPNDGSWQAVASSADAPDTVMHPFEHGALFGFLHRVDGHPEAVSGVCTHQGCRLFFDQPDDRSPPPGNCSATSWPSLAM